MSEQKYSKKLEGLFCLLRRPTVEKQGDAINQVWEKSVENGLILPENRGDIVVEGNVFIAETAFERLCKNLRARVLCVIEATYGGNYDADCFAYRDFFLLEGDESFSVETAFLVSKDHAHKYRSRSASKGRSLNERTIINESGPLELLQKAEEQGIKALKYEEPAEIPELIRGLIQKLTL